VFGDPWGKSRSLSETTSYDPRCLYHLLKPQQAASDHLVEAWHHTYGLPVVLTNVQQNYGAVAIYPEKLIPVQ